METVDLRNAGYAGNAAVEWVVRKAGALTTRVPVSYTHLTLPTSDLV